MHQARQPSHSRRFAEPHDLRQPSVLGRKNRPGIGYPLPAALICLVLFALAGMVDRVHHRLEWKFKLLSIPLLPGARVFPVDDDAQFVGIPGMAQQPRGIEFDDSRFSPPLVGVEGVTPELIWGDPAIVHLPFTRFTDAHMPLIADAPTLRSLILDGTEISDAGLDHLPCLRRLKNLSLAGTRIGDRSIDVISRYSSLRYLNLSGTRISNRALELLADLNGLEILDVSHTAIDARGLARLRTIPKLTFLRLDDIPLDDDGIAALCTLKSLRGLHLRGTGINDNQLRQLASLQQLDECFVDGNIQRGRALDDLRKKGDLSAE
jgi:Leucine Rich repeat